MYIPFETKLASAIAAGSVLLGGSLLGAPGDILFQTEFNTPGDLEGWTDTGDRHVGFDGTGQEDVITNGDGDGVLAAQISGGDPQLMQTGLSIDNGLVGTVRARIRKSDGLGGWISPVTDLGLVNADLVLFPGAGGNQGAPTKTADETVVGDGWTLLEWDAEDIFGATITSIRWDPLNAAIGDSFEIDYFRLIEGENPVAVEIDPAGAIPAGFNLVREWDTAAQLGDLTTANLSPTAAGAPGVTIGPCTNNASADCLFGVSLNGDPQVNSPGGLAIPLASDKELIVEIGIIGDNDFGTTTTELFWSDDTGGFAGARRVPFAAVPDDDALHVIRTTWSNGSINGKLNQIRFDPATAVDIDCEIDYIRIYTNTPLPTEFFWDTDTGTSGDQGGTGNWNLADNFWWDGASNTIWPAAPSGDDNAAFGGTAGTVTIDPAGITATSLKFTVDGYTIDGGTLALDSSLVDGFFNVDGGSVTATVEALVDGTDDDVRKAGTGTLVLDNAANVFNSYTSASGTTSIPAGASLTTTGTNPSENGFAFKMTGSSTLNIDGTLDADDGSFGGFSGDNGWTVNVNSGANVTLSNAYVGWNASVTYNFNDGTTNATGFLRHQDGGSPTINVFGGTHTFGGELGAVTNGGGSNTTFNITGGTFNAGNVQFNPSTAGGGTGSNTYTLNLDGGTLETNRVSVRRGGAPDAGGINTLFLKLNGGTLRASTGGASNSLIDDNIGTELVVGDTIYTATVEAGGAIIDTNGECKSVDQPLVVGAVAGGSLTKQGLGALYLNEANTYDGGTSVTAGTLGGAGSVVGDVTISAGAGLAYFETDPGAPTGGLSIGGILTVPDPLVISIDSGDGTFTEADATGLVVATASSISGSPTLNLDTTKFTGLGTWSNPRVVGNQVLVDYTAGSDPFGSYMDTFYPGESDPLIVGPDADPDGDGVSNLKEFALGGNPSVSDGGATAAFGVNDVLGTDYFTITVAVRAGATFSGGVDVLTASQDGVDYTIAGTDDLQTFDALIDEVTPAIAGGLVAPAGYELKTFRLNPDASAGIGFIQCSVAETP